MAKFRIEKGNFKNFLLKTSCNGIIKFRDSKKVEQPLFSCFYLDAKDDRLEVLTIDTVKKKIQMNSVITGIEVIEPGVITISDYKAIVEVLSGRGLDKGLVTVWNEGNKIFIETEKDGYEIRQRDNSDIEIFTAKKGKMIKYLNAWRKAHAFEFEEREVEVDGQIIKFKDEGLLIATVKDPKTKEKLVIPFSTKIEVSKEDLLKLVDDTVRLTKDNKTVISLHDGVLKAFKGEANARITGKHIIDYKDLGSELIDFEKSFYNIQTIVPNLFDKITFNIRKIGTDNSLAIWIKSVDEKSKTEINIGLLSIKE
ncbi:hypothetical protein LCGC14_0912600 [marine sediment metagenome]|uniref:Uncharacterized protein n=1 Tax=marine sediment metagenome TaxID=412755 RepID=A0A0F9PDW8_9ZZZZ